MVIIEKKEFDKIVRMFDYTHNDKSSLYLLQILQYKPSSLGETKLRQESFQYYISKLTDTFPIAYYRTEMSVIHSFTIDIIRPLSKKDFLWKYFSEKKDYNEITSKLRTVISFFSKINKLITSFSKIDKHHIYSSEIREMIVFLEKLDITQWERKLQSGHLGHQEIRAFYNKLSAFSDQNRIETFWEQYFYFEALLSIAFAIKKNSFQFPVLSENRDDIFIREFYYPFLKKESILNDLQIHKNVVVLTGPNMSGKSTLLKAIGIAVYLANLGLGAPLQAGSTIPYFDDIFVFINHVDDVDNGLSHFMKELENCKMAFRHAKKGDSCFAVFDEVFQGTNSAESISITQYTLKNLIKFNNCVFIFSTHLYEIFDADFIKENLIQTLYLDCTIVANKPNFSFKVKEGISTLKIGEWLFRSEGLYDLLK